MNGPLAPLRAHRVVVVSRWALALAVAITVAALVGSLLPRVPMPEGPFGDKILHAAGYAALAFFWRRALQGPTVGLLLIAVVGFGALVECLQGLTPWRSFEWADMLANGTGATIGLLLGGAVQALRGRSGGG